MTNFSTQGNTPENVKFFIHESFGTAWSKTIARVWLYKKDSDSSERAALIEDGKFTDIIDPNADDVWYNQLLSNDTVEVKNALVEEGMVDLSSLTAGSDDWKRWMTSTVYVLLAGSSRTIDIEAGSDELGLYSRPSAGNNGWEAVNGIDHTVVLTLPEAPANAAEFAIALADYCCTGKTYVFSC